MPDKNLKSFMVLVDNLENLADGAKKHSSEEGYPPEVTEEKVRVAKQELEDAREKYVLTASEASKLKETYEQMEQETLKKVSRFKTMIYGFYGKKSKEVQDFGLKPYRAKSSAKNNNNVEATA